MLGLIPVAHFQQSLSAGASPSGFAAWPSFPLANPANYADPGCVAYDITGLHLPYTHTSLYGWSAADCVEDLNVVCERLPWVPEVRRAYWAVYAVNVPYSLRL